MWYSELIVCPDCKRKMSLVDTRAVCDECGFRCGGDTVTDLRPGKPRLVEITLSPSQEATPVQCLSTIKIEAPKISYDGPAAIRDSRELMSVLQQNLRIGSRVLDLGCGPKDQKAPVEYLGFDYLGIDYSSIAADFLGDAHAIPIRENSFDCVLSYAVLEHLHSPYIAVREIERVLKPGGIYVGTVSQGEPFHDSYFHLTPWGLVSLISSTRSLKIEQLWDSMDTLASLSRIGRYPRAIRLMIGLVDKVHRLFPFLAPRKMNWPQSEKQLDRLYRTGGIAFVIRKNSDDQMKSGYVKDPDWALAASR